MDLDESRTANQSRTEGKTYSLRQDLRLKIDGYCKSVGHSRRFVHPEDLAGIVNEDPETIKSILNEMDGYNQTTTGDDLSFENPYYAGDF